MRKLQYPAIYKHFKGMYYASMGISEPIENVEGKINLIYQVYFYSDGNF